MIHTFSQVVLPGYVIVDVLKCTAQSLMKLNVAKNLVGSALAGSIGGNNAHAANVVAACFLACGQDPAQVGGLVFPTLRLAIFDMRS